MSSASKKFVFFCGKGGVGKTTCAAATAVKLASMGYKTLLFSTDPAHSTSDSLEQKLDRNISEVKNISCLYAVEIDAAFELKKFTDQYSEEIYYSLKDTTYFDNEDIQALLLLSLPGIDELMAVKSIIDFIDFENSFEYFVCDTAPTGHALRLISMPDVVNDWIKTIASIRWKYKDIMGRISQNSYETHDLFYILKKIVGKVKSTLKNPAQAVFNIVAIPESMAVEETKRLVASFNKMGIIVRNLVINNVVPENHLCVFCSGIRTHQNIYIEQLHQNFTNMNISTTLRKGPQITGISELTEFSKDLILKGVFD